MSPTPPNPKIHLASLVTRSTESLSFISPGRVVMRYDESNREMFSFPDDKWRIYPDSSVWYGGTVATRVGEADEEDGDVESFRMRCFDSFVTSGPRVSLFGHAPTTALQKKIKLSIAGQAPFDVDLLQDPSSDVSQQASSSTSPPRTYRKLYESPELISPHQTFLYDVEIIFYNVPLGMSVDFAEIAFNGQGGLWRGSKAVVDSADANIVYAGSWEEMRTLASGDDWTIGSQDTLGEGVETRPLVAEPYGGSVHAGRAVGDSITLHFYGEQITVSGLLEKGQQGVVGASFSLDGRPAETRKFGSSSPARSSNGGDSHWQPHFELFSVNDLDIVAHSLTINITEIAPTSNVSSPPPALYIDYFTMENVYPLSPGMLRDRTSRPVESLRRDKPASMGGNIIMPIVLSIAVTLMLLVWCFRRRLFGLCGVRRCRLRPCSTGVGVEGVVMENDGMKRGFGKVRLDLELSLIGGRGKFARSTVLDIRPQQMRSETSPEGLSRAMLAPPQAVLGSMGRPPEYTFYPSPSSSSSSAAPSPPTTGQEMAPSPSTQQTVRGASRLTSIPATTTEPPVLSSSCERVARRGYESSSTRELVGLVGYLSRARNRVRTVIGRQVDNWGGTWGAWTGTWTAFRLGATTNGMGQMPPPYRSVG